MTTNQAIAYLADILMDRTRDQREYNLLRNIKDSMRSMHDPHPGPSQVRMHMHDAMAQSMSVDPFAEHRYLMEHLRPIPRSAPDPIGLEDRLRIYEWALVTFEDRYREGPGGYGICAHLSWLVEPDHEGPGFLENNFPEIACQRPTGRHMNGFWWPNSEAGMTKRLNAFQKAIESCRDQMAADIADAAVAACPISRPAESASHQAVSRDLPNQNRHL